MICETQYRDRLLKELRSAELETVREYFCDTDCVLEVGGGSGWQARQISRWVGSVESIDVGPSSNWSEQHFEVQSYDGVHIPFPDDTFDVVYSSNVLEHVEDLSALLMDCKRVIRGGGIAIHTVPSVAWRVATLLTYYPYQVSRLLTRARSREWVGVGQQSGRQAPPSRSRGMLQIARKCLLDSPHGTSRNAIRELWDFSLNRWRSTLEASGLRVERILPTGIFNSGYMICGSLEVSSRARLAAFLGSSGHSFVLRKA